MAGEADAARKKLDAARTIFQRLGAASEVERTDALTCR
jgi:hypothetical protein